MRQSQASREAYKSWQLLQRRIAQLWRQKHGRAILIAPVVLLLLMLAWISPNSAPASTSANTLGRQESHVTPFVNVSSQPGNSSSRKWAGAAADITKFVIEPGDEPVNASVTAAALTHILEFPEDLDGPDKESLMSVIDPAEFKAKKDFNGLVAPTSRMFRAPGRFKANATRSSLLVAMPSDRSHLAIVEASHAWRKEVRAFIALNDSQLVASRMNDTDPQEVWGYYPDDWPLKGLHAGDSRAALTPFLAHEAFQGQYDWMLYGDDDTFFFIDNILELLQDFDPNMPYIITDHYWWDDATFNYSHYHPHEKAPHCLPCHWTAEDEERSLRADGYRPFVGYPACPCTMQHICRHDERGLFNENCDVPTYPERAYSIHGGAGAILSIGLMNQLPINFMERCLADKDNGTGGDAFFSECVMRAGYGFTDPGYSFYHWEAKAFDPGPEISRKLVQDFSEAVLSTCDTASLDIISRVVTAHVRSINQGEKDTAQVIHTLSTVYDRWRAKVSATLLQAQGSFATSNSRPSGSAAALRARTNLGGDVADIPKGIADPTDAGDSHSMHSRTADVQRNSNLNDRTAGRGSDSTAGIAGTGAMSAADILSDIADSMSEEDADRTGSRSNIAAEALQSAVASHDDTITAGAARTAGRAATSGTAGNRATRDEEVLSSVANTRQSGRNAAAGRSRTAGAHAVTDEDVDNVVQDGRQSSRSDPAADTHTTTSDSRSVAEIIREIASRRDPLDDMPDEEVANPQGDTGSHVLHAEIQNAWAQDADDFGLGEVEEADEEDLLDRAVTANLAGAGRQSAAAAATGRNVEHRSNLESLQAIPDDDNEMVSLSLPQRAKHRPGVATNRNTEAQISQESEQGMADEDEDDENMSLDLLQPARTSSAGTNARSAQANAKSAEGVQQRPSTANTGQRQNAEHVHTAAEDLNMDRLLETASSGGMSAGLELDLSGNNTEAMSRGN